MDRYICNSSPQTNYFGGSGHGDYDSEMGHFFLLHRLGKGSGYKIAQLESLTEDETLFVGGKEIQVSV